ncbi:MAG: PDZ domain-containing protein, partial [Pseudomonadota bacterium]
RIQDVDDEIAEAIGLEEVAGALVTEVPEGPAREGGMLDGDVILSFDGVDVADTRGLVRQVGNSPVGETVRVVVFRDGETVTLRITLGRREEAEGAVPAVAEAPDEEEEPSSKLVLGMTLNPLTDELREELGVASDQAGLAVTDVDETSEAFEKGLRSGDIITEAGQQVVTTISEFEDRLIDVKEAGRKSLLLLVRRAGDPRFVALGVGE